MLHLPQIRLHIEVQRRGCIRMAQYFLHALDVCAVLKEQRCACVPQIVGRNAL